MSRRSEFQNKVVWITGASSGIGRELAAQVAGRGARTVLTARREEALRETQQLCGGEERSVVVPGDVSDLEGINKLVDTAWNAFGRVDIAVLNAGVSQRGRVIETEPEVIYRMNALNFLAPALIARRIAPHMLQAGGGHIVAVSTLATRLATPLRSSYVASKAGMETFLTVLRRELVGTGVRVSLALPGFVRTEISRHALASDGTAHGVVDKAQEEGMPADECARRIVRGIERGKREILIPSDLRTRFGLFLARWAPSILERMIAKADVT